MVKTAEEKKINLSLTKDEALILREMMMPFADESMKIRVALQNGELAIKIINGIGTPEKKE